MKFPHFTQLEYTDCAPACLRMILKYYGKNCNLSFLRELCETGKSGANLLEISHAAEILNFETLGVSASTDALNTKIPLPCILHWRQDHFVVLYKITTTKYYISDPAFGRIKLSPSAFEHLWKGENEKGTVLLIQPNADFSNTSLPFDERDRAWKSTLEYIGNHLKRHKPELFQIGSLIAASTYVSYLMPHLIQKLVDKGVNKGNTSVIWGVLFFQLAIVAGELTFEWFRGRARVNLSMHLSIKIISHFLLKLILLPVSFFDTKLHADILQRIDDHQKIETFLSQKIVQNLFAVILFAVLSAQLLLYNFQFFLIFLIISGFSFAWMFLFYKQRKHLDYYSFRVTSENRNSLQELITGMTEIKINNAQVIKINKWKLIQDKLYDLKMKTLKVNLSQSLGVSVLTKVKNIILTFLCALAVVAHKLTLGEMLGIGYIVGQLSGPIETLNDFFQSGQDAFLALSRIEEINKKPNENTGDKVLISENVKKGVEFKNVSFRYRGNSSPFVLTDISLSIPKSKVTAIVGGSGSGKSTLLKLLLNFYTPQHGNIYIDKINMTEIDSDSWRDRCGIVLQDGYIFSGTIAENIAISDPSPDIELLAFAAKTACILDFIDMLPMKFNTKIGNSGLTLSGGQKQRILIARAVYKNPDFIFFDEATSSLDANNERNIIENLNLFFQNKTVVIIAHRLSTVKNADQIIVLDKGKITEIGTHQELARSKGHYYQLVKNQLELE